MSLKRRTVFIITGAIVYYILSFFIVVGVASYFVHDNMKKADTRADEKTLQNDKPAISIQSLWEHTNKQRGKKGLGQLSLNPQLNKSALSKCKDMTNRDYWSHNAPNGTEPWIFIQKKGVAYTYAGENLAYGFTEAESITKGWMDSKTHRENILSNKFTHVGFGICKSKNFVGDGPQTIIVQHFTG